MSRSCARGAVFDMTIRPSGTIEGVERRRQATSFPAGNMPADALAGRSAIRPTR